MSDLSGYEVAERIRREAWGSKTTMIALTGWGQEQGKRTAMAEGFNFHLTKPVDPERQEYSAGPNSFHAVGRTADSVKPQRRGKP
jgi:CheY-like chemotaxis protein